MRVLVTGGAGFIGSNFVIRSLQTRSDVQITVLDALTYAGSLTNLEEVRSEIRFVQGDINDKSLVDSLVQDADLVFHFAAESHNDNSLIDPEAFVRTNVNGTFELIQACAKHNLRFHHISTDEVFGDLALNDPTKFSELSPYKPSSPYSATKAAADMLVRSWVRSFGLRATISNCSNNYGPHQHIEKLIPKTIVLAASGVRPKVYGSGSNVRDWIHVDDHTDGVWGIVDKGRLGETYLLGANGERSNLEVVGLILKELGLTPDFLEFVNDRPGHDLRYAIDATKAMTELGWRPKHTTFEDGMVEVIEHYKARLSNGLIDISTISNSGSSSGGQG